MEGGDSTVVIFNLPHSKNLVFQSVLCNNIELVKAIIDTGAGISVISPELCKRLLLIPKPWVGPDLLVAGETRVKPSGVVYLNLIISNKTIEHVEMVVTEINEYLLLLGNNCLQQLKTITITYPVNQPPVFSTGTDFDILENSAKSNTIICKN